MYVEYYVFSLDEEDMERMEMSKDYHEKEPIEEEKPKEDFTHRDRVQTSQKG